MYLAREDEIQGTLSSTVEENRFIQEFIFQIQEKSHLEQSQKYLDYLKRVNRYKGISESNLSKKVKIIIPFLTYLHKRNIVNGEVVDPFKEYVDNQISSFRKNKPKVKKEKTTRDRNYPVIISEFLVFLENNNYYGVDRYKRRIVIFQQFLENNGININVFLEENKENFLFEQIGKYENMLSSRVSKEEIVLSTVTSYLRAVQLFVKYLSSKSLVTKKYTIPIHLRGRSKRANEYVPKDRIIEMMNAIYDYSHHVIRDLAIFLIIVDTGCRPIEVCNLTMGDVDKVERTLSFQCGKTKKEK